MIENGGIIVLCQSQKTGDRKEAIVDEIGAAVQVVVLQVDLQVVDVGKMFFI